MNPKTFSQIESIENAIESYKVKLPNKAEDTKYQLSMLLQKLKDKVIKIYYNERLNLLRSLLIILISACAKESELESTGEIVKYIFSKNILKLLIENLKKTATKEPEKKLDNRFKQQFLFQMIQEEEITLQCLFCILSEYQSEVDKVEDLKLDLIKYFFDNKFEGYYYFNGSKMVVTNEYASVIKAKSDLVREWSIYCSLLCLSINLQKPVISESLSKIINTSFSDDKGAIVSLLKISGYIVGKYALKVNGVEESKSKEFSKLDFGKALRDINSSPALEAIKTLLKGDLMRDKEYEYVKGSLQNILKWWIEKACELQIQNMLKDSEIISDILVEFIKEKYWLEEFWSHDFRQDTSFYKMIKNHYLKQFPYDPKFLCYICYYLMGEKDYNFTDILMEFLGNFSSFVEYLNQSKDLEKLRLPGDDEFDYVTKEAFNYGIYIPEGTKARRIYKGKDLFELDVKYDIWTLFFIKWEEILECLSDRNMPVARINVFEIQLQYIVKFISKLLILSPEKVEFINPNLTDVSNIKNNVEKITDLLLKSLERLKILLHLYKNDLHESLDAISMIIKAIGSLYTKHTYRKYISDIFDLFEENIEEHGRLLSSSYPSYGGGSNKLFQMLKELSSIESSVGTYSVTKAISKLGSIIMRDPSPSHNLMKIFECVKSLKISKTLDNLEVQLNLLELYKHTLLKFTTWMTKTDIDIKNANQDQAFNTFNCYSSFQGSFINRGTKGNILVSLNFIINTNNYWNSEDFIGKLSIE